MWLSVPSAHTLGHMGWVWRWDTGLLGTQGGLGSRAGLGWVLKGLGVHSYLEAFAVP